MKLSLLLLTSSLVIAATGAFAQNDACTNNYGGCMERCITRPASVQASCTQTCEANSNVCYDQMYKASAQGGAAQASGPVSEAKAEPDVTDARDEAKPEPKTKAKRKRH